MLEPRGSFASVAAKIRRAEEHVDTLYGEVKAWSEHHPNAFIFRRDPEGAAFLHRIYVRFAVIPPLEDWGLIFGDAVHNLRSALDHLIYAFAVKETRTDPPPGWDALQFPILDDATRWRDDSARIAGLNDDMRTFVQGVQPYEVAPENPRSDYLWIIREFDNADKHRAIRPVGGVAHDLNVPLKVPRPDFAPTVVIHNAALVDEREALFAEITGLEKSEVQGYLSGKFSVGVENSDGAAINMTGFAEELRKRVTDVTGDAQKRFFPDTL